MAIFGALGPIVFAACAAATAVAGARPVRYVSCDGDDANDGLAPETPWRSLERLNGAFPPGGLALLRRGDVFYGRLRIPSGPSPDCHTVVDAYGHGAPPEISAYKIAKRDEAVWERVGENMWRIDLADKTCFHGNRSTADGNIGFLKVDGIIRGRKTFPSYRKRPEEPWEFIDDHRRVTVYCATNPALAAKDIRFAPRMDLAWCGSNVTIQNVAMRGTGAHGVSTTNPSHLRIVNCAFSEIGGSHLESDPDKGGTRYGNAVQLWRGAFDVCISNCVFSDVYDVAFTMQGAKPPRSWENVQVVCCTMSNCTQNFEIWTTQCAQGVGFKKCAFESNVCVGTSRGWGWDVRPDRKNGVPLLLYGMETDVCDIVVRGNVFRDFRDALIGRGSLGALPQGYRIEKNTIVMPKDAPLCAEPSKDEASVAREHAIRRDNFFSFAFDN